MRPLARLAVILTIALVPTGAIALDFGDPAFLRAPSPDLNAPKLRRLTLPMADQGSSSNISGMSATPSPTAAAGTVARLFADQATMVAGKADLASPTFTGTVAAPALSLTGAGLTGPVSAASVTPSGGAAAGTLARIIADQNTMIAGKVGAASPTFTGTVTAPILALTSAGSTGPVDGMSVLGRSLTARESEAKNLLDTSGADPTGVANSSPALTSTVAANGKAVYIPPGAYKLDTVFDPAANTLIDAFGASFTPGRLGTIGDLTAFPSRTLMKTTTTAGTDNVMNIAYVAKTSSASASFQKSALFIRATTQDGGSCAGSPLQGCKDLVALTASGNIAAGVSGGRAYAANLTGDIGSGSTGLLDVMEISPYNNSGTDKTADFYTGVGGGTGTNINGIKFVCGGTKPCDAANYITSFNGTQSPWASAIRVLRSTVRDYILEVNDDMTGNLYNTSAFIRPNGAAKFAALQATGAFTASAGLFASAGTFVGDNSIAIQGTSGTATATITSSNGPISISGPGGQNAKGVLTGMTYKNGDPTTSDIPTGFCADYFNQATSVFKHWCNVGGTMRSVTMN